MQNHLVLITLLAGGCILSVACGGSPSTGSQSDGGPGMMMTTTGSSSSGGSSDDSGITAPPGGEGGTSSSSSSGAGDSGSTTPTSDAAGPGTDGGFPPGWLYTEGNKIMVSTGSTATRWMGRGVNMDDIFMCGNNNNLQQSNPDMTQQTEIDGLMSGWKPSFVRYSLSMNSFKAVSWLSNPAQYQTPVMNAIHHLGSYPGLYVLLTLRSDVSMMVGDSGNKDPTWIPSDSTTTPDKTKFPMGTDPVYTALVDAFAQDNYIIFALSNEPGGSVKTDATISSAMNHAVGVIRAEEDKLGVPHHLVSVQGNGYTSQLKMYTATPSPITHDNVVYELHYYPGLAGETPSNYQYADTLPMIIGEYGDFTSSVPQSGFYTDMEAKMIPNLAWDFDPFSGCAPDLLNVTHSATMLQPTSWGMSVQTYLLAHAK
jgi:hypothetical protein